jgi:hypothetical protein
MKQCRKCLLPKTLEEFPPRKDSKDGRHSYCHKCMATIMSKFHKKYPEKNRAHCRNKTKRLYEISNAAKSVGCKFCPEKTLVCLDFHHLNQNDKDMNIAALITKGSEIRLRNEIAKCAVVCSNCHRKLHAGLIQIGD